MYLFTLNKVCKAHFFLPPYGSSKALASGSLCSSFPGVNGLIIDHFPGPGPPLIISRHFVLLYL